MARRWTRISQPVERARADELSSGSAAFQSVRRVLSVIRVRMLPCPAARNYSSRANHQISGRFPHRSERTRALSQLESANPRLLAS